MNSNDLRYVLALQRASNLGDRTAKKLIARLGSAEAIFKEKRQNLLKIEGIGELKLKGLLDPANFEAAEKELEFIEQEQLETHYFLDANYPDKLKHCHDSPILLFSKGTIKLQNRRIISIVGTRKITSAGKAFVEEFIEELSPLDPVIVSGFAYGVDIAAHRAAITHNLQTIGCLAHGLDQVYPKMHAKYVDEVLKNGGFFSDFWSSDSFDRNNFLKRNRIIAGLSEATVVIESAEKGGSLVTADIANSYNREVFAVPGRPGDKYSKGCNALIKSNNAHLLSSAADLVYMLGWKLDDEIKPVQQQLFIDLDEEEQLIYDQLKEKGKSQLDTIALYCNFPTFKTASILLNMELKGVIRPLPGKLFEAI